MSESKDAEFVKAVEASSPGEYAAALSWADHLAERGGEAFGPGTPPLSCFDVALALRWAARRQKWPARRDSGGKEWTWACQGSSAEPVAQFAVRHPESVLPPAVYCGTLYPSEQANAFTWTHHKTWEGAVVVLATALRRLRELAQ